MNARAGEQESLLSRKSSEDGEEDQDLAYQTFPILHAEISAAEDEQAAIANTNDEGVPALGLIRSIVITFCLMILLFIQAANISMLTTTQGVIAADLDAFEYTSWFTSAYLVALSSIAPLNGRLSHIFSPRWCVFVSALITAAGILITGFAADLTGFLIGRAVTGVGAAGIFTVAIILLVQLTTLKRRGLFTGVLNTMYTIGVAAGAVVAGALEPAVGWRALFWMQAPFAAVAGLGLLFAIPVSVTATPDANLGGKKTTTLQKLAKIDYLGAALLIASIVTMLYGLSTPKKISWNPIFASFVLIPLFLAQELYGAVDPIIPLSVLSSRGALLSCLSTVGFMMSRWSVLFYAPIFMTAVRGAAPAKAGSILIATNTGFALGGLLPGYFHIRRGGSYWTSCLVVFALFPISLAALAIESTHTAPLWGYILAIFVNGLLAGAALNYTLAHVLHLVAPDVRFIVTSLIATFRGFAGTFGSAVGGGIFARVLRASLENGFQDHHIPITPAIQDLIRELSGSPRLVRSLEGAQFEIAIKGYEDALKALFFSGVAFACLAWIAQAGTGWTGPDDHAVKDEENAQRGRGT